MGKLKYKKMNCQNQISNVGGARIWTRQGISSILLTTDPYHLTFLKILIKYLIFLTHGKYSINDNCCFCCWIYSYDNYFSLLWLTHHLVLNLTRSQGLKIWKVELALLEIFICHGFSLTLTGGGSLLPRRSSKLSTSHPSLVARLQ